jgi:hypothetical protein
MAISNRSSLRLPALLIIDISAVLALTFLVTQGIIPLYPAVPIAYLLLFALNVLFVWGHSFRRKDTPSKAAPIRLSLWIVAGVFTFAGIAAFVAYARDPTMPLAVQAAVAILLVGYIWFLIYRLRYGRRNQMSK